MFILSQKWATQPCIHPIVCKNVKRIIEDKYAFIVYYSGCIAHGIDLVLEDIEKTQWVHKIVNEAKSNIKFVNSHHKSQAFFKEFSSKENNLELLRPRDIQFGTHFIMLERL